jgi:quinol monooxygenase YgiN
MSRKYVDCRETPSVSGCTLAMSGEEDELVRAAVLHAVDVHEHADDEELRAGVRDGLRDVPVADTRPGAFLQLIEFRTDRIDEVEALEAEYSEAMGAKRTARWMVLTTDRDRPGTYLQIVEFPDYTAAMANSENPVTTRFAERLAKLCEGAPRFFNLDVRTTMAE